MSTLTFTSFRRSLQLLLTNTISLEILSQNSLPIESGTVVSVSALRFLEIDRSKNSRISSSDCFSCIQGLSFLCGGRGEEKHDKESEFGKFKKLGDLRSKQNKQLKKIYRTRLHDLVKTKGGESVAKIWNALIKYNPADLIEPKLYDMFLDELENIRSKKPNEVLTVSDFKDVENQTRDELYNFVKKPKVDSVRDCPWDDLLEVSDREEIGKGASGPVYKAHLQDWQILFPNVAGKSQMSSDAIGENQKYYVLKTANKKEAKIHEKLDNSEHPGYNKIGKVRRIYVPKSGSIEMVMDHYAGGSLYPDADDETHKVKGNKFSEDEAHQITKQLLEALSFLKTQKINHLDIKPQNIVRESPYSSDVRLIDLGSAVEFTNFSEKSPSLSVYEPVGTFEYMAPEILLDGKVGFHSDMWSLGVVVFMMLHGPNSHPFNDENFLEDCRNDQVSVDEIQNFVRNRRREQCKNEENFQTSREKPQKPVSAVSWNKPSELSDDCKDFLNKMLVWNPKDRMSVEVALEHPWITMGPQSKSQTNNFKLKAHGSDIRDKNMFSVLRDEKSRSLLAPEKDAVPYL